MNRQWMYTAERRSKEFIDYVHYFLSVANAHKPKGFIRCPCKSAKTRRSILHLRSLHIHLLESGFIPGYNCYTLHGELVVAIEENE